VKVGDLVKYIEGHVAYPRLGIIIKEGTFGMRQGFFIHWNHPELAGTRHVWFAEEKYLELAA